MATGAGRSRHRQTPTQARAARRARRRTRRRLWRYGGGAAIGAIAFTFIIALFLPTIPGGLAGDGGFFGRGNPSGPGERLPEQVPTHVSPGEAHPAYNSVPATSGWHYGGALAPVRWGIHSRFLEDEVRLHNLEHGGVSILYSCPDGCSELVAQLAAIVDRSRGEGLKVLMSPYPDMDSRIALTAWTFIDKFDVFDEERVKEFIRAHESSGNSPEPLAQ